MLFWVIVALLTLAASLAVMQSFLRQKNSAFSSEEHDLAVYSDQLDELEREVKRGLISPQDAAEARAEIGRRILQLDRMRDSASTGRNSLARGIAVAAVLSVPLVSWGVYGLIGAPGLPARPLQARLEGDPSQATIGELIARIEAHLATNPQDARGWETLAPIYSRLGRFGDAVAAYRKTIALAGPNATREAALGEALVGESGGVVTADAEAAFERALALDEENPRARFFTAMARAQEGNKAEARRIWEAMAADLPDDSPWKETAQQAMAGLDAGEQREAGPSEAEIAAVREMSPEARQAMIEDMVKGLDAKLRDDPSDPAAWRRLIRSYMVLGNTAEARSALARAQEAFGVGSEEAAALSEYADDLGLKQGG